MSKNKMSRAALICSILCFVMAVIVFVFTDGLQRWYSGIFFLLMALVMLVNARRWRHVTGAKL